MVRAEPPGSAPHQRSGARTGQSQRAVTPLGVVPACARTGQSQRATEGDFAMKVGYVFGASKHRRDTCDAFGPFPVTFLIRARERSLRKTRKCVTRVTLVFAA